MNTALMKVMDDWGYYLLPKSHAGSPGYGGVMVAMRQTPTELHYDPEIMQVRLADHGDVAWTSLTFYAALNGLSAVLPGRVIIIDRFDKHVEFFTFGAVVEEHRGLHEVIFVLTSDIPVLMDTGEDSNVGDHLTYACEALLARQQAQRLGECHSEKESNATRLDAAGLYQTSLTEAINRLKRTPGLCAGSRGICASLNDEMTWQITQGKWKTANRDGG